MQKPEEEVDVEQFTLSEGPSAVRDSVTGWGTNGQKIDNVQAPDCVAKVVESSETSTSRHFVKFSAAGPTAGSMVNPGEDVDLGRPGDWTSQGRFVFRPVSKLAFDLYLWFLTTGNPLYLHQAAREIQI